MLKLVFKKYDTTPLLEITLFGECKADGKLLHSTRIHLIFTPKWRMYG